MILCHLSGGHFATVLKINDLLTKSFLDYVNLEKQPQLDLEANALSEFETGDLNPIDQDTTCLFSSKKRRKSKPKWQKSLISSMIFNYWMKPNQPPVPEFSKVLRDRMDSWHHFHPWKGEVPQGSAWVPGPVKC